MITVSCVKRTSVSTAVEPFSESFYATKELNFRDLEKLESIYKNNSEQSFAAGLILGRYYTSKGMRKKGIALLEENYKEKYLSKYMRFSGMLWLFDAYGKDKREDKALEYFTMVNNRKDEDPFPMIIKSYCSFEKIKITNDPFNDCVANRFTSMEPVQTDSQEIEKMPSITIIDDEQEEKQTALIEEVKLKKVFLVGGMDLDFMQGAITAVTYKRAPFKLEMGEGYGVNIAEIDVSKNTLMVNNHEYDFDINKMEIVDATINYSVKNKGVTIIAVSDDYSGYLEYAVDRVKSENGAVYTVNFERGSFENEVRSISRKHSDNTVYNVVIFSPESKLIDVASLVRYSVKNPERTNIYIGTDSFGKRNLNDDLIAYYRRANIFTPAFLANNSNADTFRSIYKDQYGEEPPFSAYLAYDIVSFLKGEATTFSATDISYIDRDKAVRVIKGYRILSADRFVEIELAD